MVKSRTYSNQFRCLFAGTLAGNARGNAEQRVGVAFTLVEKGLAYGGPGVVAGQHSSSLKFLDCQAWPYRG